MCNGQIVCYVNRKGEKIMTRLPSRHNTTTIKTRYEYNVGEGALHAVPQQPYSHFDDAIVMLTSVILCGFIYCVTIGF